MKHIKWPRNIWPSIRHFISHQSASSHPHHTSSPGMCQCGVLIPSSIPYVLIGCDWPFVLAAVCGPNVFPTLRQLEWQSVELRIIFLSPANLDLVWGFVSGVCQSLTTHNIRIHGFEFNITLQWMMIDSCTLALANTCALANILTSKVARI